jgi:hypothetical protein
MKKNTKITSILVSILLVLGMISINSCKDDNTLPQINGYDNSDQVAATYLKAHWTFDDTYNEAISATAPSNKYGGYAFATGQIGKALNLTAGTLVYPSIPNIGGANSLPNFSVSLWINVKDNKGSAAEGFTSFFGIIYTSTSDVWGNVMACAETSRHPASSDTLELKNYLNTTLPDNSQSGQDNVAQHNNETGNGLWFKGANKWSHYVMTWDGSTHQFLLYGDAVSCGAWNDRGTTPALVMRTPCQAVFGSLAASDIGFASAPGRQGWNPMATAMIDDVRVYNTVLTQADITALFNLGTAGR